MIVVLAALTALLTLSIAPDRASAFMYNTAGPSNGNTVLATPSGLSMTASQSGSSTRHFGFKSNGHIYVPGGTFSPSAVPSSTGATSSPNVIAPEVSLDGCVASRTPADCNLNKFLTLAFSQPVINPILNISGIGGYYDYSDGYRNYVHIEGEISGSSPTGVHAGAAVGSPKNMKLTGDRWGVNNDLLSTMCTSAAPSGATGGCMSFPLIGAPVSSVTFKMLGRAYRSSGTRTMTAPVIDEIRVSASYRQDFSDAPASYNGSQAPTHAITDMRLGTLVNEDAANTLNPTTSPNAVAAGADANTKDADDDGVSNWPVLTTGDAGKTYSVNAAISGASKSGRVCGWIDFNGNGTFDSGERTCSSFNSGATSVNLSWTVPSGQLAAGTTYARVRASYNTSQVQNPTGVADSGEVEDYSLAILPQITVKKSLSSPYTNDKFDLQIDNVTYAAGVSDNGTTGAKTVFHTSDFGAPDITVAQNIRNGAINFTAREVADGSNAGNYTSAWTCTSAAGNSNSGVGKTTTGANLPKSNVNNGQDQDVTCTFTNTLDPATPVFTDPPEDGVTGSDITFEGTSDPGVVIKLYDENDNLLCTSAPAGATGSWTCEVTGLPDGPHTVKADATWGPNTSPRAETDFTVDTTPKDVKITSPGPGAVITTSNPTVTGTSNAADGETVVVTIDVGGTPVTICSAAEVNDSAWSCVSEADFSDKDLIPDGDYDITAALTSDPGVKDQTNVTVSTTPPTITITGPTSSDVLYSGTPEISGTTADAPEGSAVTVTIDDPDNPGQQIELCTTTVDAVGDWSCTSSVVLPDGQAEITATVEHKVNKKKATDTTEPTIDTSPLVIEIDGPSGPIDTNQPTVNGTTDAPAGSSVVVTYVDNGTPIEVCTASVDGSGDWECDTESSVTLPEGDVTLFATVEAVDVQGNAKSATDDTDVTVYTAAPTIEITTPSGQINTTTPTISGTSDAPEGSEVVVTYDDNGTPVELCTTTVDEDGDWSCDATDDLPQGAVTITAEVTHLYNGKTADDDTSVNVDTLAPAIEIDGPAGWIDDNQPNIHGTSDAPEDSVVVVTWDDNGTPVELCTTTVDADGKWDCDPTVQLPESTTGLTITAEVTHLNNGKTAEDNTVVKVLTSTPDIAITGPADGSATDDPQSAISGTTDNAPDGSEVVVTVPDPDSPGDDLVICQATVSNDAWECAAGTLVNPLPEGNVPITATVTTPVNKTADDVVNVIVFEGPPTVTISGPSGDIPTTTPDITGTSNAPDGAEIVVTWDDNGTPVELCTTTVTSNSWSCDGDDLDNPLPEGPSVITATVTDQLGRTADDSSSVDVNSLAPKLKITGPSGLISINTPEITGTTDQDPGLPVSVTVDGVEICEATVIAGTPNNTWSCTPDEADKLPEGPSTIKATITNPINNLSTTDTTNVTVDTQAPGIAITGPSGLINTTTPLIWGTTTDAPAGSPLVVTRPGENPGDPAIEVCTTTVKANGSWNCTPTSANALPQGPVDLTATVTDPAGNSASAVTSVTVDSVAPEIEITGPSGPINTNTPEITGTTDEPAGSTVIVSVGGSELCEATVVSGSPKNTWSCTPDAADALPDGPATITAEITDPAGNRAEDTTDVVVDTVAPTIEIDGPAGPINNNQPTIHGTSDEIGGTVTVTIPGTRPGETVELCTAVVQSDNSWTCDTDSSVMLPEGSSTITASVSDAAGNEATDSTGVSVRTTVPTIKISGPSGLINDNTPKIEGTTTGAPTGSTVVVTRPGDNPGDPAIEVCTTTVMYGGAWDCTPLAADALPEGEVELTATVTDQYGNSDDDTTDVDVDTVPPETTITKTPTNPSTDLDPKFEFEADEPGSTFECRIDGGPWVSCESGDNFGPLLPGPHEFEVRATDPAGNTDPTPDKYVWQVDLPSPVIVGPGPAGGLTNNNQPPITGTHGQPGATITVYDQGGNLVCTATVQSNQTWGCTPNAPLADGPHVFDAVATFNGIDSPKSNVGRITIDTVPPVITIGSPTGNEKPVFTLTNNDPSSTPTQRCRIDGGAWVPCGDQFAPGTLSTGEHTIEVEAHDPAGNRGVAGPMQFFVSGTDAMDQCIPRGITIYSLRLVRGKLEVRGFARSKHAGKTVSINYLPTKNRVLGRAKVRADGSFIARVKAPAKRLRGSNRTRYRATVQRETSLWFKFSRRMPVAVANVRGGKISVSGKLTKPLHPKYPVTITVRAACDEPFKTVGTLKVNRRTGSFKGTFDLQTNTKVVFVRMRTRVRKTSRSRAVMPTMSFVLPTVVQP